MKCGALKADQIKTKLLDWLISKDKDAIFANEMMFSPRKRRADLTCFKKGKLIAFEIKGDFDNTRRLFGQIRDYLQTFDLVYIVITPKFLKQLPFIRSSHVGIILFDSQFKIIRQAKLNKTAKTHLVYLLDKASLLKALKQSYTLQSLDIIRRRAVRKLSLVKTKRLSYSKLFARYKPLYELFLRDRQTHTIQDDLLNLTGVIHPLHKIQ